MSFHVHLAALGMSFYWPLAAYLPHMAGQPPRSAVNALFLQPRQVDLYREFH
jgi:hypothetical protein